jgi:caffeoyl-CoA O-methyltransferase
MADSDSRQGARYGSGEVLTFVEKVHAGHDAGLAAAYAAPEREKMPAIQVAPSEGKLLELLMKMIGARRVVELGTLAGYSTIRLARGLAAGGRLWTIELDPRHAEVARKNLLVAGVADRVEVCVGRGTEVLATLEQHGPFDAVFVDADKESYDQYGRWAAKHLRAGGLLLGDNAYFFGRLLEQSPGANAMRRFHEEAAGAFDSVCAPTPDGLLVGLKR